MVRVDVMHQVIKPEPDTVGAWPAREVVAGVDQTGPAENREENRGVGKIILHRLHVRYRPGSVNIILDSWEYVTRTPVPDPVPFVRPLPASLGGCHGVAGVNGVREVPSEVPPCTLVTTSNEPG